jgi:hypothetical protein
MLHPVEFVTDYVPCTILDPAKVKVLRDLMAYGKQHWDFMTFADAKTTLTSPSPTPSPTRSPSTAPPTTAANLRNGSPTGKKSSATMMIAIPLGVIGAIGIMLVGYRIYRGGAAASSSPGGELVAGKDTATIDPTESPLHPQSK